MPGTHLQVPPLLAAQGFCLRPLQQPDLPWLRRLYASTRSAEMAMLPLPPAAVEAFMQQQFDLQHHHYLRHYNDAEFLALDHSDHGPAGRLYLHCGALDLLIVDISLLPAFRGQGIGKALIQQVQARAKTRSCGVALHVIESNIHARRLYHQLGFVATEGQMHIPMHWRAPPAPAS